VAGNDKKEHFTLLNQFAGLLKCSVDNKKSSLKSRTLNSNTTMNGAIIKPILNWK
jgi:hypothetical protein